MPSDPHVISLGVYDSTPAAVSAAIEHFRALAEDGRARDAIVVIDGSVAVEHIPAPDRWLEEVGRYVRLAERMSTTTLVVGYVEDAGLCVVVRAPSGELTSWTAPRRGSVVGAWSVRPGDELDLAPVIAW